MVSFKLPQDPELRKYYKGMGVLSLIVILVIGLNLFGNTAARHDNAIAANITQFKENIDSYYATNHKLPAILPDANINDSKGIDYKKISGTRYMLCANFKTKSDGYQNQPVPYLVNGASLQAAQETKYTNGNTDGLKHDKGYTCIYYSVSDWNPDGCNPGTGVLCPLNLNGSSSTPISDPTAGTACKVPTTYAVKGYSQMELGMVANHEIDLDTQNQKLTDTNGKTLTIPPITKLQYDDNTVFCKKQTAASVNDARSGQYIIFYLNKTTDIIPAYIELDPPLSP